MPDYYVYLKTGAHGGSGDGADTNTIPLRATNVSIATNKTIPSIPLPIGVLTGESVTAALDLGMSNKTIDVSGFIIDTDIKRHDTTIKMTAHEIAQLLHSSVDSTGIAKHQALVELVFLMPSFVNENYVDRGKAADTSVSENGTVSANIPWTFRARGGPNLLDNRLVFGALPFPENENSTGVTGFVRSFSTNIAADTIEIEFSLNFEVALVRP
jgi:hypothetical protein